ncbi:MAG TPA: YdeI/OmpD-associated family protein [Anaerolineales bacterium]|nr:YdeI/OmpD-associated family protein [Anaerolineales bacterium]
MEIKNTLHVTNRKDWRKWLREHYKTEKEIWLVYHKKKTGKPRIEYNDAVEEALCFGWIDSTLKSLDKDRNAQRFTPRKPKSAYSPANKERLRKLVKQRKVIKEVRESLGDILDEKLEIPADILKAIKANKEAWNNFQAFSDSYKRIRIGFIEGARKRPGEFQKRLRYFIKMTEKNKLYGFGGIDKHF